MMADTSRNAIVTGGSKGIGKAITLALLAHGFKVMAVGRDEAALTGLYEQASKHKTADALTLVAEDLAGSEGCQNLVAAARQKLGHVDILINNAGIGGFALHQPNEPAPRFWETNEQDWQKFLTLNATTAFILSRAFAPEMIARGWGRIINITTSLGSMMAGRMAAYGSSKAALEALTAIMSEDLKDTGVTANVVTPGGYTATDMLPLDLPMDRSKMLPPEIMVPPILWLLSEDGGRANGRRYIAMKWDANAPSEAAEQHAGAPVAWKALAAMPVAAGKLA